MGSETAFNWIAAGVILSGLSMLGGAVAMAALYRTVKKLSDEVTPLIPETRKTLASAHEALVEIRKDVHQVTVKSSEVLDSAKSQLAHFNEARAEFTDRARTQAEKLEIVLDDAMSRFQDMTERVEGTVMKPIREVNGIMAGVRAALDMLRLGRRKVITQATQDEEMFI
jgi:hypothetical protein